MLFTAVVKRHESLRTSFVVQDGVPFQSIDSDASVSLERVDVAPLPPDLRAHEAERHMLVLRRSPFDLTRGPLLRAALYRMAEEEHQLLIVIHHIVADGWSIGVLLHELGALYSAAFVGGPHSLPPLSWQYSDYATRQREWLRGTEVQSQLDYWRSQLEGLADLDLPLDRDQCDSGMHAAHNRDALLTPTETETLKACARASGTTTYMFVLTCLQVLLHRLSGQDDVAVGSPVAGRSSHESEGLVGFFVNMLVLRAGLEGNRTFRAQLARTREVVLAAFAHQDVPFERLLEELRPRRGLDRTPLFRVYFNMLSFREDEPGIRRTHGPTGAPAGDRGELRPDPVRKGGRREA